MIVCLCRAVTDRDVRAARARGADTVETVASLTGAGTGCGCCRDVVAKILAEPLDPAGAVAAARGRETSCGPGRCAACPNRSAEGVPQRVAAGPLKSP